MYMGIIFTALGEETGYLKEKFCKEFFLDSNNCPLCFYKCKYLNERFIRAYEFCNYFYQRSTF